MLVLPAAVCSAQEQVNSSHQILPDDWSRTHVAFMIIRLMTMFAVVSRRLHTALALCMRNRHEWQTQQ